jgi:hypothetical protein
LKEYVVAEERATSANGKKGSERRSKAGKYEFDEGDKK